MGAPQPALVERMKKAGYAQPDKIMSGKDALPAGAYFRDLAEKGKVDVIRVGRYIFVDEEQARKAWAKKMAPPPPPPPKPKPLRLKEMPVPKRVRVADVPDGYSESRLRKIVREEVIAAFSDDTFGQLVQAHVRAVFNEK